MSSFNKHIDKNMDNYLGYNVFNSNIIIVFALRNIDNNK